MEMTTSEKVAHLHQIAKRVLDAPNFGDAFYAAKDLYNVAEDHLYDFVNREVLGMPGWCGVDAKEGWGYEELTADPYDTSIEFKDARLGFQVTPEQKSKLRDQGITHGWICYEDGTEAHF
jgi:hypothetical protein